MRCVENPINTNAQNSTMEERNIVERWDIFDETYPDVSRDILKPILIMRYNREAGPGLNWYSSEILYKSGAIIVLLMFENMTTMVTSNTAGIASLNARCWVTKGYPLHVPDYLVIISTNPANLKNCILSMFIDRSITAHYAPGMIEIAPMDPGQKQAVYHLMKRSFPLTMRPFLSLKGSVLTAREDGKLLGAVILNRCCRGLVGVISWIFTCREARGRGVAQKLLEAGTDQLAKLGCSDLIAVVEGDNTSSSNRFASLGFYRTNAWEQVRNFSTRLPSVLLHSLHVFDIGFFLWHKRISEEPYRSPDIPPILYWLFMLAVLFVLSPGISLPVLCIILGIRQGAALLGYRLASRTPVTYRVWGTGLILSGVISLLFGSFFPAVGSLYPEKSSWNYNQYRKALGISAGCAAWAVILTAALLASGIVPDHNSAGHLMAALLFFDILLPIFPFSSFSSGRMLKYSRIWYGITAAVAAVMVFILLTS